MFEVHDKEALEERRKELLVVEPRLRFFAFAHLRLAFQGASAKFCAMAIDMVETIPDNEQRALALQKLIEVKDCAVRAKL